MAESRWQRRSRAAALLTATTWAAVYPPPGSADPRAPARPEQPGVRLQAPEFDSTPAASERRSSGAADASLAALPALQTADRGTPAQRLRQRLDPLSLLRREIYGDVERDAGTVLSYPGAVDFSAPQRAAAADPIVIPATTVEPADDRIEPASGSPPELLGTASTDFGTDPAFAADAPPLRQLPSPREAPYLSGEHAPVPVLPSVSSPAPSADLALPRAVEPSGVGVRLDANLLQGPPEFTPWWQAQVQQPLQAASNPVTVDVELLILTAIEFLPAVERVQFAPQTIRWPLTTSFTGLPIGRGDPQSICVGFSPPLVGGDGRTLLSGRSVAIDWSPAAELSPGLTALQDHLTAVALGYWDLYFARTLFVQRQRLLDETVALEQTLLGQPENRARHELLLLVRAAAAERRLLWLRAADDVLRAETRLVRLIQDPALLTAARRELVSDESPARTLPPLPPDAVLATALHHRAELPRAVAILRHAACAAGLDLDQIDQQLDSALAAAVQHVPGSIELQPFPSQAPLPAPVNLSTDAKVRSVSLHRAAEALQRTVQEISDDVTQALRRVHLAQADLAASLLRLQAAEEYAARCQGRWNVGIHQDAIGPDLLAGLLQAQQALSQAEAAFSAAQIHFELSLIDLRRATGTLLDSIPEGEAQPPPPPSPATRTGDEPVANSRSGEAAPDGPQIRPAALRWWRR